MRGVHPFERIEEGAEPGLVLVCPEAAAERPKLVAFREWLLGEARATAR